MNLLAWFRKRASARRDRQARPELAAFAAAAARLTKGDIAIDCGANVGKFTVMMARNGATVHAFEPNPAAFAELRRNTAEFANVQLHATAITTSPGRAGYADSCAAAGGASRKKPASAVHGTMRSWARRVTAPPVQRPSSVSTSITAAVSSFRMW